MTTTTTPALEDLTKEQVRELLRECALVIKPGETLILRVRDLTPEQMDQYQRWLDTLRFPFRMAVVYADELAAGATP